MKHRPYGKNSRRPTLICRDFLQIRGLGMTVPARNERLAILGKISPGVFMLNVEK